MITNRKLLVGLIALINIIFVSFLITNQAIITNIFIQIIISLSILLISFNNFKNGDQLMGGLFLASFILLTVNFLR